MKVCKGYNRQQNALIETKNGCLPPFGGREGADARTRYAYKNSATQVLLLQEVIDSLKPAGRAGFVVDEGLLFSATCLGT